MLLKRILTALFLLPLVIASIFWMPIIPFAIILAALTLVGAWEWSGLIGLTRTTLRLSYAALIGLGMLTTCVLPNISFLILFVATIIWVWAFFAILNYQNEGSGAGFQMPAVRALIGFIVLIAMWLSIIMLKANPQFGPAWLMIVLLMIWGVDTGGYFAGRFFGKYALCSRVSPKKTWEGFVGGMVVALVVAAIAGKCLSLSHQRYIAFMLLAVVTALISVVGDLAVSLLKRITGVKDSGKFFPGHGGVLDRLDSVAAATVIFVFVAMMFGM